MSETCKICSGAIRTVSKWAGIPPCVRGGVASVGGCAPRAP